ncbi:MAG TPA: OsmC family peroxiredoxin [Spirochaetia bacterium]|nr:OsmC family peroxiredoxin [Spirochaetia bacterium]
MPVRKGNAMWRGDLPKGSGTLGTESGTLKGVSYSSASRFESDRGTNPEELLAAAHAACYSMALAGGLAGRGYKVNSVRTEDSVHIDKQGDGFTITTVEIDTEASVDGIDDATFQKFAEETKVGCPVSKALTGPKMVLRARLKK